ncbi:MAG: hypothetical protein VX473_03705 [Candidatus Thermoplasmatota archaeon]|nr:hypothetical protein [Candidatus Thermoplasmatota archaeon]
MRGRALLLVLPLLLMSWAPVTMSLEEAPPTRESPEDGTYDVLMLGNSYTSQNSLSSRVQALFDEAGTPASVSDLTGGGMKLYQHADNAESTGNQWNTALTTNQYDFVILQDQSQVPSFPTTESMWQNSKNGAIRLDSMIEAAGAETIFFMTWGYRDGDSNNAWLNPDYPTMQANLESGYNMYAENITSTERAPYIAPVGLAYKAIYDGIIADGGTPTDQGTLFYNLYSGDGAHPSTRGTYLAACVMHSTMTGDSSIGMADPFGFDSDTRMKLQQAADSVVFDDTLGYTYPWQNEPSSEPEDNTTGGSNLWFGSSNGTNVLIEPGGGSGFTVNITNNASFTDIADIQIQTDTGWDMSWNYGDGNPANGYTLEMDSDSLHWIQFSISVPEVSMGLPLAGSKHSFTAIATSQHDGNSTSWTFTIEVLPWNGAEVAIQPENATLDPGTEVRVPVTVRNLGNEERDMAVRIRPVSAEGVPIPGHEPATSFIQNGWSVEIWELYNVLDVGPHQTGTVQLEFHAPNIPTGTMWIEFSTWSSGANQQISTAMVEVSILRERSATIEFIDEDCALMDAGDLCTSEFRIQNTGNYQDDYEIEWESPQSIELQMSRTVFNLQPGESTDVDVIYVVESGLPAGFQMVPTIRMKTVDGIEVGTISTTIEVAVKIDWEISAEYILKDDEENITLTYTLRNIGNADDGLDVTLSTNVLTPCGLIPPASSQWDSEDGVPHHFILNDIPSGESVTFESWMQLPRNQEVNGTAEITIDMRSTLEPDILFTNRTEFEYLAEAWRPENVDEESGWDDFIAGVQSIWNDWHQIILSIIVTLIGAVVLHRAVVYRKRRDAEWAEMIASRNVEPEKVEDWMGRFSEKQTEISEPSLGPEMDADAFKTAFKMGSKPKPERQSPSDDIMQAANTVFDHHDEKADFEAMEKLSDDLLDSSEPHEANALFDPSESVGSRTVRHPRKETQSKSAISDDEIDLDL